MFPKVPCIISTAVFTLIDLFKIAQKSTIFLGYFCKQICCHVLLKNRPIWSRGLYYFNLGTLCLSLSPPPHYIHQLIPLMKSIDNFKSGIQWLTCGQSYKAPTIVIFDSRVVPHLISPHIMTLES